MFFGLRTTFFSPSQHHPGALEEGFLCASYVNPGSVVLSGSTNLNDTVGHFLVLRHTLDRHNPGKKLNGLRDCAWHVGGRLHIQAELMQRAGRGGKTFVDVPGGVSSLERCSPRCELCLASPS